MPSGLASAAQQALDGMTMGSPDAIIALRAAISACTACARHLEAGPRPVVQFSESARILIIGQAPGRRVHESGVPWDDPSGARLRDWTGLSDEEFYDAARVALVPMGFCYPGKGKGGDLPPRPECAPLWHGHILACLPPTRLTLLVGSYAQARYLPSLKALTLDERVRETSRDEDDVVALPHPSWRSTIWMRKNPWFEAETLPRLRLKIRRRIDRP